MLLFLLFFASGSLANELDSMRLFFEPVTPELKGEPAKPSVVQQQARSYYYNGFIATNTGVRYIVNGVLLSELKRIELVAVSDAGRTLKLKTNTGFEFNLSIGETRVAALVQADRKSE